MSTRSSAAARRQAAVQAAQEARTRRLRQTRLAVVLMLLLVAGGTVALTLSQRGGDDDALAPVDAQGLLTTPPPWPAQTEGLAGRLADLGFPPVGDESYHAHVLLSVYRNGRSVPVPAGIGFGTDGSHSSLHTHTPDGLIHMEADDPYPYELAQVFKVWGVAFDPNRLGADTTSGKNRVHVYVNGKPAADGPVVLKDKDNIVVAYGEEGSFPAAPPTGPLENA